MRCPPRRLIRAGEGRSIRGLQFGLADVLAAPSRRKRLLHLLPRRAGSHSELLMSPTAACTMMYGGRNEPQLNNHNINALIIVINLSRGVRKSARRPETGRGVKNDGELRPALYYCLAARPQTKRLCERVRFRVAARFLARRLIKMLMKLYHNSYFNNVRMAERPRPVRNPISSPAGPAKGK